MTAPVVRIDGRRIVDRESFHDVFAEAFGFPDFYGRNMDAWIDCLSSLGSSDDGLTQIRAPEGGVVALQLDHADALSARCPEVFEDLVNCSAPVNLRLLERGRSPVLALAFARNTAMRRSPSPSSG
ncbi:barstar family protein [Pelagibius sp.]|uniref:barstar family protein n=1 Tax=Pelagibius sp. TaxID=1931238 RepID=UPI002618CD5E|nr:barstar family protein [Pelagibius sp.]